MERVGPDEPAWRVLGSPESLHEFRTAPRLGCMVCTDIIGLGEKYAPWPSGLPAPAGSVLGMEEDRPAKAARHVHERCWRWFVRQQERHARRAG